MLIEPSRKLPNCACSAEIASLVHGSIIEHHRISSEPRCELNAMRMATLARRKGGSQFGVALNVSVIKVAALRDATARSTSRLACSNVVGRSVRVRTSGTSLITPSVMGAFGVVEQQGETRPREAPRV